MCYNKGVRIDVGCSDFEGAAANRKRIAAGEHLVWWLWYEALVRGGPLRKALPLWVPQGGLPRVGKHEQRDLHKYGIHRINEEF